MLAAAEEVPSQGALDAPTRLVPPCAAVLVAGAMEGPDFPASLSFQERANEQGPVKPALSCVEGTERATSEHHLLFRHSGLLLADPHSEGKGHTRISRRESGRLGSWMLLAGRTQQGNKNPFLAQGE